MDLKDNPFYILKLPCSATRKQIYAAADELSLWDSSGQAEEAQVKLLNPVSRLSAEMDWFPGFDANQSGEICACIAELRPIQLTSEDSLTNLNILLYNMTCAQDQNEPLLHLITNTSRVFSAITNEDVHMRLSACHSMAGIPAPRASSVKEQLKDKRSQIVRSLSLKLQPLPEKQYIQMMTGFGEGLQESYDEIIADLIDQYELRMHDSIEEQTRAVYAEIQKLRNIGYTLSWAERMKLLVQYVKAWDGLSQPIQLKCYANGMSYTSGKQLGNSLADLAVFFCNDKKDPEAAMHLIQEIEPVFKEIPDAANMLADLEKQLVSILARRNQLAQQGRFADTQRIRTKSHLSGSGYVIFVLLSVLLFFLITCNDGSSSSRKPDYQPLPTFHTLPLPSFDIGSLPVPSFDHGPVWEQPYYAAPTLNPHILDLIKPDLTLPAIPEEFLFPESFDIEESTESIEP